MIIFRPKLYGFQKFSFSLIFLTTSIQLILGFFGVCYLRPCLHSGEASYLPAPVLRICVLL